MENHWTALFHDFLCGLPICWFNSTYSVHLSTSFFWVRRLIPVEPIRTSFGILSKFVSVSIPLPRRRAAAVALLALRVQINLYVQKLKWKKITQKTMCINCRRPLGLAVNTQSNKNVKPYNQSKSVEIAKQLSQPFHAHTKQHSHTHSYARNALNWWQRKSINWNILSACQVWSAG